MFPAPVATGTGDRSPRRSAADDRAALTQAFDPAHPVARRRELWGRDEQLDQMSDGVLYQRKHAIVHGARGSGKTSLVRVFADQADRQGAVLIYLACDAHTDFAGLMRPFIRFVPSANIPSGRERAFRMQADALGPDFGPRALVSLLVELAPKPIIFILDEFDRITDRGVQDAVATTMKLLSDAKAPVQLLVVGIAQSVTELIEHHPSLRRHMIAVLVRQIADADITKLIEDGGQRARLVFDPEANAAIVQAACGSPYHARLFAYHSGLLALSRGGGRVTRAIALAGLARAADEWGGMNETDHSLFARVADSAATSRLSLMELAMLAAREQWVSPARFDQSGDAVLDALAPALEGSAAKVRFRDSLAPQFLIAMLLVDEGKVTAPRPIPRMQE